MRIRKEDTVICITGRNKGKKGKVRHVFTKGDRIVVEGVNMIKRHSRTRGKARQSGIIELEAPLHVSDVKLVCDKCGKPTRVGFRFLDDARKVRVCHSCGEVID